MTFVGAPAGSTPRGAWRETPRVYRAGEPPMTTTSLTTTLWPPPAPPRPRARRRRDAAPDTRAERVRRRLVRTAPRDDYERVGYRGVIVNRRTKELCQRAEFIMRHLRGHAGFRFRFGQGSYHPGVAASSNTHDGGGAIDVRTRGLPAWVVDDMVRSLREAGFAAWSRGRGHDAFAPHIHAVAIGDVEAHPAAAAQVVDYFTGCDGLAPGVDDPDAHLGRSVPRWARRR